LGLVACERNEFEKARALLKESINTFSKLQDKLGMCEAVEAFACLAAKERKWKRTAVSLSLFPLCSLYSTQLLLTFLYIVWSR
jgi:hypothetical protein